MIIWHRDRKRVVIKLTRDKRAHDEVWSLEGLVNRRWLMDASGNWLKVVDIEDPGIFVAIPAHDVKRMVLIPVAGNHMTNSDTDFEFSCLSTRGQFLWTAN